MESPARPVTVAVGQFDVRLGDIDANLASAGRLAERAAEAGASLLLLPEMATAGYAFASPEELRPYAEPATATELGRGLTGWAELGRRHGLLIAGGFPELAGPSTSADPAAGGGASALAAADGPAHGSLYNSAAIVGAGGLVGLYRKVHLFFNEKDLFRPGDLGFPVFDLPFGRVGLQVCYDVFFPEAARSLALGGADLVLTPGNFVRNFRRRIHDERGMIQAGVAAMGIAAQNQVYVAVADRIGDERDLGFIGGSVIVGWDGWPLAGPASEAGEELLVAEVDLAEAARKKQRNPRNHAFADRREDQYRTTSSVAADGAGTGRGEPAASASA
ncbi:MAG TPA: nitrilase-related carbon-nitrogen hydrolase [Candidatus Dormibacteraeota bacterium]|jgi:predicted amidohydrolase|nr:nitrilase-related carbon-nitrogen hydrolase [Candidatus Dormibacteraeota bacterium]